MCESIPNSCTSQSGEEPSILALDKDLLGDSWDILPCIALPEDKQVAASCDPQCLEAPFVAVIHLVQGIVEVACNI